MLSKRLYVLSAVVLLLLTAIPALGTSFTGKVVGVTDGDTIRVMHGTAPEKVRLNRIDCPEMSQDYGYRAKQAASDLCFGKLVTIKSAGKDRYGRTLGEVILSNGTNVNEALVAQGYAWWYRQYAPNDKTLPKLEAKAKAAKLGLWAGKNPMPPWEYRHGGATRTASSANTPAAKTSGAVGKQQSSGSSTTVYITQSGKKYHRAGCRYLARSSIPIALSDALARSYTPCSVCGGGGSSSAHSSSLQRSAPPAAKATPASDMVHVTRTGAKYHRGGCRYLSRSDIPISRKDAISQGYSPCSVCAP